MKKTSDNSSSVSSIAVQAVLSPRAAELALRGEEREPSRRPVHPLGSADERVDKFDNDLRIIHANGLEQSYAVRILQEDEREELERRKGRALTPKEVKEELHSENTWRRAIRRKIGAWYDTKAPPAKASSVSFPEPKTSAAAPAAIVPAPRPVVSTTSATSTAASAAASAPASATAPAQRPAQEARSKPAAAPVSIEEGAGTWL